MGTVQKKKKIETSGIFGATHLVHLYMPLPYIRVGVRKSASLLLLRNLCLKALCISAALLMFSAKDPFGES